MVAQRWDSSTCQNIGPAGASTGQLWTVCHRARARRVATTLSIGAGNRWWKGWVPPAALPCLVSGARAAGPGTPGAGCYEAPRQWVVGLTVPGAAFNAVTEGLA
jgi:hypothetical protein